MTTVYRNLTTTCLAAVLAFGLAACGGGSSTPDSPTQALTCPDGQEPNAAGDACVDTAATTAGKVTQTLLAAHQEASGAIDDAKAAGMAASEAVKDATKYSGMLDVAGVMGDSTEARMNAQKVLDASDAVDQAVMDAEAAKKRATDAETTVMALAEGTEGRMQALDALSNAIEEADAQIAATMAIQTGVNADNTASTEGQALKMAVQMVTGTNAKMPETPDDIADGVAMAIGGALLPTNDGSVQGSTADGTARRVTHYDGTSGNEVPTTAPAVAMRTFHDTNSPGMTWAMIVGEDNVMMERIGTNNAATPVASIAGMDASAVDKTATAVLASDGGAASDGKYPDGAAVGTASATGAPGTEYKGIPGAVWCLGGSAGCSVNAAGKLSDGWYFTPTSTTNVYILNPTVANRQATLYVADEDYVTWGHWLTVDTTGGATDGQVTVHTYAILPTGSNTENLNLGEDTSAGAVNTATYTGSAAGMSVQKSFDGNGKQTAIHSGAFTADVSLTATFGATAMLSGTVDNFQGGAHADPNWSVDLEETALTAAGNFGTGTLGVAKGSGQAGDWSTQGHGPSTAADPKRPTGFFGNFEAHFTDGHASGAYAARE